MTFRDMVSMVMLHADKAVPRSTVEVILKSLAKAATHELRRAGRFELTGVARLSVGIQKGRMRRNPRTGEPVWSPDRRVLKVRPTRPLKEALNDPQEPGR